MKIAKLPKNASSISAFSFYNHQEAENKKGKKDKSLASGSKAKGKSNLTKTLKKQVSVVTKKKKLTNGTKGPKNIMEIVGNAPVLKTSMKQLTHANKIKNKAPAPQPIKEKKMKSIVMKETRDGESSGSFSTKKASVKANGTTEVKENGSSGIPFTTISKKTKATSDAKNVRFMHFLSRTCKSEKSSKDIGKDLFSYIIAPHKIEDFFSTVWETKHLLIKRGKPDYFDGLFSAQLLDKILRNHYIEYTKNIDITSYSDGVRQTHNPAGKAFPPVVWDYFNNGCSIRMLNPQTFHKPVWQLLAGLQEYFGSFCGANIYLTPEDTQGFAPHWDDIEAFVIQLEGKKRWRVYNPRNKGEVLPRFSSANLSQEEIGSPILDVVLEPGDLLYFPRGFIHQAEAVEGSYSLHITLSTYQKNAWVDLIEKMLSPSVLSQAAAKQVSLRKGLPLGCLEYMGKMGKGCAKDDAGALNARKKFKETLASLITNAVLNDDVIDTAVDEVARQFVRVALPPALTDEEKICSVVEDGESWTPLGIKGRVEIEPDTEIRLIRAHCCRVVKDPKDGSDEYRIYHSSVNSREYEGREEQYVFLDKKFLPAIQTLMKAYPIYTPVENLPSVNMEEKLTFAMALWEQNLLRTSCPLHAVDDEDFDECLVEELI